MCVSPEGGPFVHRSRTPVMRLKRHVPKSVSRCRRVVSALPSTRFSQMNRPTDQSRVESSLVISQVSEQQSDDDEARVRFRSLSDCRKRADSKCVKSRKCVSPVESLNAQVRRMPSFGCRSRSRTRVKCVKCPSKCVVGRWPSFTAAGLRRAPNRMRKFVECLRVKCRSGPWESRAFRRRPSFAVAGLPYCALPRSPNVPKAAPSFTVAGLP
ncbi:unnamed protein product [Acanthosepion pharaonis]|uniref:Uncharacterized protein n=1 Tax=Acanthosepion pharaonis TaxID=158019 RepID=A0A812EP56_ACAPH|nr:unnamed protein product [Sepia pharaonis]